MARFISFLLCDQICGIDVLKVREINQIHEVTHVPLVPTYIHGLINLRGQIVTMIDLVRRIGFSGYQESADSYNVILKNNGSSDSDQLTSQSGPSQITETIGLRVGEIGEVIDVGERAIEPAPANVAEIDARFFSGVYNLGATLLLILNLNEVLRAE